MSEQTQNQETAQQLAEEENHIIAERRAKLAALREAGVAYPNDFVRTDLFGDIRAKYQDATAEELEELKPEVACSGRMMLKRIMGKASFATVRDFTGDMQYFITKGDIGEEAYAAWKTFDLGDIVAVKGTLFRTKTGELSIRAHELRLMTKNIRPLPDKHKGLVDTEMCYRQRYVDLIMNEDSRNRFLVRSKAIAAIRSFMLAHRFLEVETPMLHPIPGGANAKPFITHHNALDIELYLRIALELHLKRLIVGGMERVYEIGRVFRNEGIDTHHNPEFTMLETYAAYFDFKDVMDETEGIFKAAAKVVSDNSIVTYQGTEVNFDKPFKRAHMVDLIKEYTGVDFWKEMTVEEARKIADEHGVHYESYWKVGHIINEFFEEFCEDKIVDPTFVYGHPVEISPLAKKNADDPRFTDRFELYILGGEYANAFTELNDPIDQRQRFEAQVEERKAGNDEAEGIDEDYIEAMEYGMPPTGGLGIGIDRLVMLLTNAESIRDVLLFPTMKPLDK